MIAKLNGMVIESTKFSNAIVIAPIQIGMDILRICFPIFLKSSYVYFTSDVGFIESRANFERK